MYVKSVSKWEVREKEDYKAGRWIFSFLLKILDKIIHQKFIASGLQWTSAMWFVHHHNFNYLQIQHGNSYIHLSYLSPRITKLNGKMKEDNKVRKDDDVRKGNHQKYWNIKFLFKELLNRPHEYIGTWTKT